MGTLEDKQKAIQDFVERTSGLADTAVVWMQQPGRRPATSTPGSAAIMLRISNIAEVGIPEETIEDNLFPFADKVVTLVDVAGNALTIPLHGLETGVGRVLVDSSTNDPPAPLVEAKNYWVIALDPNRIRLADTFVKTGGGDIANPVTPVVLTDAGTGTLTVKSTDDTTHALAGLAVQRSLLRVTVELRCHSADGTGTNMATAVLQRVRGRRTLSTAKDLLKAQNISLVDVDHVRAIQGTKDALLFEPRAYMDIHVLMMLTETEAQSIIRSVEATDQSQTPSKTFTVSAD